MWNCQHYERNERTKERSKPMTTKVNTKWFKDRLAQRDLSMRKLAKLMDLDPAAVSRMLRGQRDMTKLEANKISGLLTVPVTEVLRQAGVPVTEDSRALPLKARVDAAGMLHTIANKNPRRVNAPHDVPAAGLVVQIRAPDVPSDGWMFFAAAFDSRVEGFIDRLCIVELKKHGHALGVLKRGYDGERYNLVPFTGAHPIENVDPVSAAPVLWIRPV